MTRKYIDIEGALKAERERRAYYAKEQRMLAAEEAERESTQKSIEEKLEAGTLTVAELIESFGRVDEWRVIIVDENGKRVGKILCNSENAQDAMQMIVVEYEGSWRDLDIRARA